MKIEDLYIYPIKSTKGINLHEINVNSIGFENDRYFGIANSKNEIITARENPKLLQIKTEINNSTLTISYKGQSNSISLIEENKDIILLLFKKQVTGKILNEGINKWFTELLKSESKLVKINFNKLRKTDATEISFNDCYPIHLISKESVELLNEKLENPLPLNRFRPNIIVSGINAFEEENWTAITIGECEFKVVSKTKRCTLITINPETGERSKKQEPLRTLAKTFKTDAQANFGIYLVPTKLGTIRKTDTLVVQGT